MSVNVYNKSSDSLNPIAGRTPDDKVSKSNVLNTLEEISASTNPLDVAGASAVRELSSELGGFKPVIDETTGQITGYKTSIGGADTVFPFNNGNLVRQSKIDNDTCFVVVMGHTPYGGTNYGSTIYSSPGFITNMNEDCSMSLSVLVESRWTVTWNVQYTASTRKVTWTSNSAVPSEDIICTYPFKAM